MRAVYDALMRMAEPAVLATVIRVEGSAYRREGAKLLMPAAGPSIGMISGGCLEADVWEQAQSTLADGAPQLLTYDMRADDDALWGMNMGCNGLIEVLVERVLPADFAPLTDEWSQGRRAAGLVVVSEGPLLGRRMLLRQDGTTAGSLGDVALDAEAAALAEPVLAAGRPAQVECGDLKVLVDVVLPQPLLWVVGAGADAVPVVAAAAAAGWRVRVVDHRGVGDDALGRFPQAEAVLQLDPAELGAQVGEGAYVLLMNHQFDHDREYLAAMLATTPRYVGVLGPLRRTQMMLGRERLPAPVYAPVGLEIGGQGPEEIAVAILAELQAVRYGKAGVHLRRG